MACWKWQQKKQSVLARADVVVVALLLEGNGNPLVGSKLILSMRRVTLMKAILVYPRIVLLRKVICILPQK